MATMSSKKNSAMAMNIAKIDVAESFLDIILMSEKCLNRIFEEKTPGHISDTVKKLSSKMTLNTDTLMLKKLLGEYMFEQKKYPFQEEVMNESQESVIRSQAILMLYRNPGNNYMCKRVYNRFMKCIDKSIKINKL